MNYDKNNVFAKILHGDLPCEKIFENDELLCFKDANPVAKTHVLIIPKGEYIDYNDFVTNASKGKVAIFFKTIAEIATKLKVKEYRLVTNCGKNAGQIVFHFHMHLIAN